MTLGKQRRPLLIFCLSTSVAFHIGAIWLLYSNPFQFDNHSQSAMIKSAPPHQIIPKDEADLLVERMEKALEESLNTAIAMTQLPKMSPNPLEAIEDQNHEFAVNNLSDTPRTKKLFASAPKLRDSDLATIQVASNKFGTNMPPPFDPEFEASMSDFALDDELEQDPFSYKMEKYASIDLSDHRFENETPATAQIIEDDYTMTDEQFSPSALPTHRSDGLDPHFVASLKKLRTPQIKKNAEEMSEEKMFSTLEESTAPKLILPNSVDYLRSQWIKRSLAERQLPNLEFYGLGEIATEIDWEENIDVDVSIMNAKEGNKYIFSLTIHPDFGSTTEPMKQNFYFVIDRSNSIEKQKFSRFKRAVQRSMAALRQGDNFNIYVFDKNVTKFSDKALPVTPKTIQMAEDFLDGQGSKTHFAATEVYSSLGGMLPKFYNKDELHSVILLTDGNTLLKSSKQKQAIASWSEQYEGLVNFYAAAAGKGNNLVLLDLLSYSTSGKMLYSDTNAGFPRKLVRLIKDLHNPIVKDISINITPHDGGAKVNLFPRKTSLPPMFANQPYTIVGTVDELCDLTLLIQGRNGDSWLNIRKEISSSEGARNTRLLEKLWATTQSRICYDHFLKNGKSSHLKEAVQIVAPYRGMIASEQ